VTSARLMAVPFPAPSPAIELTLEELRVAAAAVRAEYPSTSCDG